MRIIVATANLPWPANAGGKISQFRTLEALQGNCDFTIIVPVNSAEHLEEANQFQKALPNITVIPIMVGTPDRRFERVRKFSRKVIKSWNQINRNIRNSKSSAAEVKINYEFEDIEETPYYPFACLSRDFVDRVGREIDRGCDLFQAELLEMSTLGPMIPTAIPKLFVHQQLHFVYANRIRSLSKSPTPFLNYLVNRLKIEERVFLETFNHAITFSTIDALALKKFVPSLDISISPFPCPEDPIALEDCHPSTDRHFVLVASEFAPNVIGFRWFMREVWPLIKSEAPDSKVSVIGHWSEVARKSVPNHDQVIFEGFVEALAPRLSGKIMIVPLQVGSGIRTKILASWAAGCPVVTTTVGVEGLPGESGTDFMIGDDPESFAKSCLDITKNPHLRQRLVESGIRNIHKEFTLDAVRKKRLSIYQDVVHMFKNRPKT